KPVQARPPILIGGGGPRVLSIAGREADIVGINGTMTAGVVGPDAIATMTAASVDDKVGTVRRAAGERCDQIEMNIRVFLMTFTDDRAGAMAAIGGAVGMDTSFVEQSPFALIGTPEQMVADLRARRDRWGFSYVIIGAEHVEAFAPVAAELRGN
ncbi:MAG TPA: LLM class F420-dependent oxidoreductase, partial [Ilumatobacteraceae bacterium]|nr:LLM class F420-dependent oxidoreductase [Ilumatobacteraceae bacterium]